MKGGEAASLQPPLSLLLLGGGVELLEMLIRLFSILLQGPLMGYVQGHFGSLLLPKVT